MRALLVFLACCLTAGTQAGEVYRFIDSQGRVHYSDQRLVGAEEAEPLHFGQPSAPAADLPYETRRAMQTFPVTLYVSESCSSPCQSARDLLRQRGVLFSEKKIVSQEELEAFRQASGGDRVPAATVGKAWLRGFLASDWNRELDAAGYPKFAPAGPRTAP